MNSGERAVLGLVLTPALLIASPFYALALLFAWPVTLPLTALLVFAIWRWNQKAKVRQVSQAEAVYLNAWAAQTERMSTPVSSEDSLSGNDEMWDDEEMV